MNNDAVSEVKSRLNIEDVVSEYLELKRAGRNFKGLSPFNSEKTPSFMVSPEKQIWHDFSSGKGGNVFSFVMEVEGMTFREALEHLARKAGVDLSKYDKQPGRHTVSDIRPRLISMHALATHFYQKELTKTEKPLKYLRQTRGYTKQTIIDFKIGFAPDNGQALVGFLKQKGYSFQEIKQAGLGTDRRYGFSDIFVNRIVIPFVDPMGNVVGFTGRIIDDNPNAPKYLNTPATSIYDKSRFVFGLNLAKEHIRKTNFAVVVEGNLDVVASYQAGVKNVVAASGTALTQYHLKALQRFTNDIRLCFDQDKAGQAAAERSITIAQQIGVDVSMIDIPSQKDPDELIKQNAELWTQAINKPKYMIDWFIDQIESQNDITTAQGKRKFTDAVLPLIGKIGDAVEQTHYQQQIAAKLGVSLETIKQKLNQTNISTIRYKRKVKYTPRPLSKEEVELIKKEQHFLALLLGTKPKDTSAFANIPDGLFSSDAKVLFNAIINDRSQDLKQIDDYVKMIRLLYEETYQAQDESELSYQLKSLAQRLVSIYAKLKRQEISKQLALESLSKDEAERLLSEVKDIDDLVRKFK